MKCIFCNNDLDNSDEHILPVSINGRIHSKKIICSICNLNVFGEKVDPVLAELFKPIIHVLDLKNSRAIQAEDEDGNKYLIQKKGKVKQLKPEIKFEKKEDGIHFSIKGKEEDIINYLTKRVQRQKNKYNPIKPLKYKKVEVKKIEEKMPTLSFEYKFEISHLLIIELYKIALEYYAYIGLDINIIKPLLRKVHDLDENFNEIVFCNFFGEVRMIDQNEISHLIVIKSNKEERIIYAYIELFNTVCAFIPLVNNYTGNEIDYCYKQDCITGEKIDTPTKINTEPKNIIENQIQYTHEDFSLLINLLFLRHATRSFEENIDQSIVEIFKEVQKEVESEKIKESDLAEVYIKRCSDFIARSSIYHFPYVIEDSKSEENNYINYMHSNLNESYFDSFCDANKHLIGTKIQFENGELFTFDKFVKHPILERNKIRIVKVFCLLINDENMNKKYVPYYPLFESILKNTTANN